MRASHVVTWLAIGALNIAATLSAVTSRLRGVTVELALSVRQCMRRFTLRALISHTMLARRTRLEIASAIVSTGDGLIFIGVEHVVDLASGTLIGFYGTRTFCTFLSLRKLERATKAVTFEAIDALGASVSVGAKLATIRTLEISTLELAFAAHDSIVIFASRACVLIHASRAMFLGRISLAFENADPCSHPYLISVATLRACPWTAFIAASIQTCASSTTPAPIESHAKESHPASNHPTLEERHRSVPQGRKEVNPSPAV